MVDASGRIPPALARRHRAVKEPAGQRELNDPRVQQTIRETLINSKNNLLQAAYYETARNGSKIENYLARSVVEGAGKQK